MPSSAPACKAWSARPVAPDREFAARAAILQAGANIAVLSVPLTAEASTERATSAISRLHDRYVSAAFGGNARHVLIGGTAAENRDYFALIGNWLPIVIALVLALSFVLLTLAFRSIVVPLTAIAVNLLSVAAASACSCSSFKTASAPTCSASVAAIGSRPGCRSSSSRCSSASRWTTRSSCSAASRSAYHQTGNTTDGIVHGVAFRHAGGCRSPEAGTNQPRRLVLDRNDSPITVGQRVPVPPDRETQL
jgi:hypothetical protein